jgi:acetylornithine deacetylase/succinyl-diaminopimelate desuccinylase-like protein
MDRAVDLITSWIRARKVPNLQLEVVRLPGRTPLIVAEVPGKSDDTVLLYGHLDKQPPMEPWAEGLGPWTPVVRDGRLFGRGASDDGYAAFAATSAIAALADQSVPHARLLLIVEAAEESGSPDLAPYIEHLAGRLGRPSLVVCLDSGCGDYERLWSTTSLRGLAAGTLRVEVLTEGVHSGDASGVVASSFRVIRALLSRLEDERTGRILPEWLHAPIPEQRVAQARLSAQVLGDAVWSKMPWVPGSGPIARDAVELALNRTWRPMLAITGQAGMPPLESAGNVLRPMTAFKLSLRLPPTVEAGPAAAKLKTLLEADPPYGARVAFELDKASGGWDAPRLAPWLEKSTDEASARFFGKPACYFGEGGSIPFMGMLGQRFPEAQFLVTGVLGPHSNAHGPNEFLDIRTAKALTACVARVLADHAAR